MLKYQRSIPSQHVPSDMSVEAMKQLSPNVQDPGLDLFRASAGQQGKHILELPNGQSSQHPPDQPAKTGENQPEHGNTVRLKLAT